MTSEPEPPQPTLNVPSGPFSVGDKVQLTDPKGRMHTIVLQSGGIYHTDKGQIPHAHLLGQESGIVVTSSGGMTFQAMRPLYEDFVLSMPRGAAIVYPKDAALIVTLGDMFPGARVVEAGVGSGALTLALLRAVGETGAVYSFERRADFAAIAAGNIADFFGTDHPAWTCTVGDLKTELPTTVLPGSMDRAVLDMLAPWECVDEVAQALTPGGVLVCYVATASQLSRTAEAIKASGQFAQPRALESMVRDWHLEGLAVRPEHRMIGHTGFLLFARRIALDTDPLERRKRPQATPASEHDLEQWFTPEITEAQIGTRTAPPKKLRKLAREAGSRARAQAVGADRTEAVAADPSQVVEAEEH